MLDLKRGGSGSGATGRVRALHRSLGAQFDEGAIGLEKLLTPLPAQARSGWIMIAKPLLILHSEGQQGTVNAQIVPNPPDRVQLGL
jgi:hypothetical protein